MAQLMPLPLTVSCFSKIQIGFTFLVPAHLGSHGKKGQLNGCVCVCAFNRLWISILAVLVAVPTVVQNSLYFLHYSLPSSGFYSTEKDNRCRCTENLSGCHIIRTIGAPPPSSPNFYAKYPFCRNPANLSWLGTSTQ